MYKKTQKHTHVPFFATAHNFPGKGSAVNRIESHGHTAFLHRHYAFAASLLLCELALITGCCVGRDILDCAVDLILA